MPTLAIEVLMFNDFHRGVKTCSTLVLRSAVMPRVRLPNPSLGLLFLLGVATVAGQTPYAGRAGAILLEDLSWDEAEHVLTPSTVVVIALGAEAKEHGHHLQLNNDFLMAEYFKKRVLGAAGQNVVVAPTINYSFYPAFLEYPGSTSLSFDTARAMFSDVVHSLAHYGPRRFYILNTGISTLRPLAQAANDLAKDGILLRYTDLTKDDPVEKRLRQSGGTHADEIETSMMLYIAPRTVRMNKAARDLNPQQPGGLTRDPHGKGTYSPTGAWGDPTLATVEKGQAVVESLVASILKDIDDLRQASLPAPK
jgi:creatinine amidohydrolase